MNEERRGEIVYEEGWRENAPVTALEEPNNNSEKELSIPETPQMNSRSKPLLLTLQLIVCVLSALALFLLKMTGNALYDSFIEFYRDELQKPIISREVFDTAQLSRLFADETITEMTPDEAAPR